MRLIVGLAALGTLVAGVAVAATPPPVPQPPPAAVCVPSSIRMEVFSSLGAKLGEYNAPFAGRAPVRPNDPYAYRCLWIDPSRPAGNNGAFQVILDITPAGLRGRVAAGDCGRNRPDSPPFYHSRKRYLTVDGTNGIPYQNAVGGNEKVVKGVLAAAEAAGVGLPCQPANPKPNPKPPPPPPPPKQLPPLSSSGDLGIDYSMPARFGLPGKQKGLIEYHETLAEIRPESWRVDFTIKRKDGKRCAGTLGLTVPGAVRIGSARNCAFYAMYPKEGMYTVTVTLADGSKTLKGTRTFVVQDWLIVGLGDSNGSGEGAPDVAGSVRPLKPARWQDRRCHRSANSYQAQAARAIERRDPRTSVTFVHLACSGATTFRGLLDEYEGIEPAPKPKYLRPQITEMAELVGGREIDAVMVSIGVNDLRFGDMAIHCIRHGDCPNAKLADTPTPTLATEIDRLRSFLPRRYAKVGAALKTAGAAPGRVFLSEYFDSTRDDNEEFCNLVSVPGVGTFTRAEAKWAHDNVLVPLNAAVRAASAANGWGGPITGAYMKFRRHGYCADDTWIVPLDDSFWDQLDTQGTLHSNTRGNTVQAQAASLTLRASFYPGGRTRPPKP